jgi:Effector-associated domain 11
LDGIAYLNTNITISCDCGNQTIFSNLQDMLETITKKELAAWQADGKMHRVVAVLLFAAEELKDAELKNAVLLQAAQLSDWQSAQANGTTSRDELAAQRNRIHEALLYWIDTLPENTPLSISTEILAKTDEKDRFLVQKAKSWWLPMAGGLAVLVAVFVLLRQDDGDRFTQNIIVKNAKGDKILENQGKVVVSSKFGLDSAKIGDNGQAMVNLSKDLAGQSVELRISHPQPYQIVGTKTYVLEKNKPIELTVALQNLDKISGRIKDEKTGLGLEGVRVSIQNVVVMTDNSGWFELMIPADKQKMFQNIFLEKKGYQSETLNEIPSSTLPATNKAIVPLVHLSLRSRVLVRGI